MANLYTVEVTVRDVPLRIEYAVDTDEGPVLERIFIGSVRIYPVTNAQAVLHSFVHEALQAMREDFQDVESALQDEEANRRHDEIVFSGSASLQDEDPSVGPEFTEKLEEILDHDLAAPHCPPCARGAWVKP